MLLSKGGHDSALRCTTLRRKAPPFAEAAGLEHCANQTQHPAVRYALGHQAQELLVVYAPEEVPQVRIHDPLLARLDLPPDPAERIMRRSPSPVTEAGIVEYRLEDR